MEISGRNKIKATVKSVKSGGVVSEVVLDVGGSDLYSVITNDSVSDMGIKNGDQVTAIVKSTSVMLMK